MILTTLPDEQIQTVVNVFPEEYKGIVTFIIAAAGVLIALYPTVIAPILSKINTNKTTQAIVDNVPTQEQIQQATDNAIAKYEKSRLLSELSQWKFKLPCLNF